MMYHRDDFIDPVIGGENDVTLLHNRFRIVSDSGFKTRLRKEAQKEMDTIYRMREISSS